MQNRRTRKEKIEAHHPGTISWEPSTSTQRVNSQKVSNQSEYGTKNYSRNNSASLALTQDLGSIKFDIVKSLSISIFIILFEIVLYFFWK